MEKFFLWIAWYPCAPCEQCFLDCLKDFVVKNFYQVPNTTKIHHEKRFLSWKFANMQHLCVCQDVILGHSDSNILLYSTYSYIYWTLSTQTHLWVDDRHFWRWWSTCFLKINVNIFDSVTDCSGNGRGVGVGFMGVASLKCLYIISIHFWSFVGLHVISNEKGGLAHLQVIREQHYVMEIVTV